MFTLQQRWRRTRLTFLFALIDSPHRDRWQIRATIWITEQRTNKNRCLATENQASLNGLNTGVHIGWSFVSACALLIHLIKWKANLCIFQQVRSEIRCFWGQAQRIVLEQKAWRTPTDLQPLTALTERRLLQHSCVFMDKDTRQQHNSI